jgi:F-box protein 9
MVQLRDIMEEPNPELESFRQQWKAEVSAKTKAESNKESSTSIAESSKTTSRPPAAPRIASYKPLDGHENIEPQSYHDLDGPSGINETEHTFSGKEPKTALEHYEKAVERETQGSLGDSLNLYRKAFKVSNMSIHGQQSSDLDLVGPAS